MQQVLTLPQAFRRNFLGNSPIWYKQVIIGFLILNPVVLAMFGPTVAGWMLIFEFIYTLFMYENHYQQ